MSNQQSPLIIGSRRELFWDDYIVEEATATLRQHHPERKEIVMNLDEPWEGEYCGYPVIFKDGDIIRLYYNAGRIILQEDTSVHHGPMTVCYAESHDDGRTFIKPDLGICEYNGSRHNNIIMRADQHIKKIDNFVVFKDTNPNCPLEERYKATAEKGRGAANGRVLCYYKSADGIHFTFGGNLVSDGWFDSLNCCFWDIHSEQYFLYMRDWSEGYYRHRKENMGTRMRGIRYSTSRDFKTWSECKPLDFGGAESVELYTNSIKPYYRADQVFLGMPSRYMEREQWEPNFDYLSNPNHRRYRCRKHMRYGSVITDCVLITSRDGIHFKRWDEAFMTPGIERSGNWVYGDCYPSWGMIETKSDLPNAPNEISFYEMEYHWVKPQIMRRHTLRKDGFLSYWAPYQTCTLLTKSFIFEGGRLSVNFATSAVGTIRINLVDPEGKPIDGFMGHAIFGDNLERPIVFEHGTDVSSLAGKPVRMHLTMSDADIYSFKFD